MKKYKIIKCDKTKEIFDVVYDMESMIGSIVEVSMIQFDLDGNAYITHNDYCWSLDDCEEM